MSAIADNFGTLSADQVSFVVSAVVFVAVFGGVLLAGMHFLARRTKDRDVFPPDLQTRSPVINPAVRSSIRPLDQLSAGYAKSSQHPSMEQPRTKPELNLRRTLFTIFKVLSALIMLGMMALTIGVYFATQPGDGSRLAFWVVAAATALAAMHLHSAIKRHRPHEEDAAEQTQFRQKAQSILSDKVVAALLSQGKVRWDIGSPEVHSIDNSTLERARSMAAAGSSMEEICRAIETDYFQWNAPHQQAYQNVLRAAIEHGV